MSNAPTKFFTKRSGTVFACIMGTFVNPTTTVNTVFGLFLIPISTEFGWPRSGVSGVLFVVAVTSALSFPMIGRSIRSAHYRVGGYLALCRCGCEVCRQIGVSEQTYYRWRREYGGLKMDQAKRMKELEQENARLRKAVSDLTLDKLILEETSKGNF